MWEGLWEGFESPFAKEVSLLSPLSEQQYVEVSKIGPTQSPEEIPENWSHQEHEWEHITTSCVIGTMHRS